MELSPRDELALLVTSSEIWGKTLRFLSSRSSAMNDNACPVDFADYCKEQVKILGKR